MSTKSRKVIWGSRIRGAKIRMPSRRGKPPAKPFARPTAPRAATWSVRMEGYGGPAQPAPTIGQCLNGGLGWLEVECNRCKTRASLPLDAIRRPRDTPLWKLEAVIEMPLLPQGPPRAAGAHDQADGDARDHAVSVGACG